MNKARIIIVDDDPIVLLSLEKLLELETSYHIQSFHNPLKALEYMNEHTAEVIISDFLMPQMNGIDFLNQAKLKLPSVTMILITGYADKENAIKAINEVGIYYYMEKPWDNNELLMIVKNAVERGGLLKELNNKYHEIKKSYISTIYRLANASEMFDDETYNHVLRIGLLSKRLAELLDFSKEYCHDIKFAAMMHDVGKIGVPKEILNKKGELTPDEYKLVQRHVDYGARVLSNPDNSILKMAYEIAKFHHEKWSGEGYSEGLKSSSIPECARIVAITDVFDALLSARPYKPPFSPDKVKEIIETDKQHFDPDFSKIFLEHFDEFLTIYEDTNKLNTEELSEYLFH